MQYFMEKLSQGLVVSLIGIGFTFVIMALLVIFIYATKYTLMLIDNKKNPKNQSINNAISEPQQTEEIDPQVVAAITAAISCYMEPEQTSQLPGSGFIVKKIRKIN